MADQSQWATNVNGILGSVFGQNGAADEIAAIGSLGKNGTQTTYPTTVADTSAGGGNTIIFIGLAIAAIFVIVMLVKK